MAGMDKQTSESKQPDPKLPSDHARCHVTFRLYTASPMTSAVEALLTLPTVDSGIGPPPRLC